LRESTQQNELKKFGLINLHLQIKSVIQRG